jgi:crossover junction endodeoxyribonuclease RuvC
VRVLGIDPGTATTGWGVLEQAFGETELRLVGYGTIITPAKTPLPQRLKTIYQGVRELISTHQPTASAIEVLFFSRNTTTALSVGHARGVAMLALAQAELPIGEYKPLEIKQAITGYGGADKKQVQRMVQMMLELEEMPRPDDAADALATAICHLHSARFQNLLQQ